MSNRLKEIRQKNKLTLKELGCMVGMLDSTLSQYENEKRNPSKEIWEKLASYFNVSVPYLKGAYSKKEILEKLQQEYICGSKENSNSINQAIKNSEITFNADLIAIAKGIVFYDQPNFNLLTEKEINNFYFWEKNFSFIFDNLAINWLVTKPLDATDEDISNALNDALSVELLRLERDDRDQQEGDEWIESPKELLEKRQDYINKHIFTDDGASYVDFTKTNGQ
ncbi:MAG: helix-turn-helix domain-containing protein [Lactobacillaceae bacterium]